MCQQLHQIIIVSPWSLLLWGQLRMDFFQQLLLRSLSFTQRSGLLTPNLLLGSTFRAFCGMLASHIKGSSLGRVCMTSGIHFVAITFKNGPRRKFPYTASCWSFPATLDIHLSARHSIIFVWLHRHSPISGMLARKNWAVCTLLSASPWKVRGCRMAKRGPTSFAKALSIDYLPAERGLSEETIQSYRDAISLLLDFCEKERHIQRDRLEVSDLTRELVESFLR